jgi:calcium-dependent protein kinase
MIDEVDFIGKNQINYTEFLTATLHTQQVLTDELLWSLFKSFDIDDTGYISTKNLQEVFKRLGRYEVTEQEIEDAINIHDVMQEHQISFQEFKLIFMKEQSQEVARLIMQ